jgi:hypothetical protein
MLARWAKPCARAAPLAEIILGSQIYRWFAFPIERPELPNLCAW